MLPFITVAGARRDRQVRRVIPTESTRQMRLKEFKGPRLQEAEGLPWWVDSNNCWKSCCPQGEGFSSAHTADSWRNRERLLLVREMAHEEFLFKQPFLPYLPPVSVVSCFYGSMRSPGCRAVTPGSPLWS